MANEKRLIDANVYCKELYAERDYPGRTQEFMDAIEVAIADLCDMPTIDAVPVDSILLHHILIDENGIPEVKLQLGDRTLVLRREGDPVDAMEVVRCKNCKKEWCYLRQELGEDGFCSAGERKNGNDRI